MIAELEDEMQEAAGRLEFEKAALIRDQVDSLRSGILQEARQGSPRRIRPHSGGLCRRGLRTPMQGRFR